MVYWIMNKIKRPKRTMLITVSNYAKRIGTTRQTVYNHIKTCSVVTEVIDGVTFIRVLRDDRVEKDKRVQ